MIILKYCIIISFLWNFILIGLQRVCIRNIKSWKMQSVVPKKGYSHLKKKSLQCFFFCTPPPPPYSYPPALSPPPHYGNHWCHLCYFCGDVIYFHNNKTYSFFWEYKVLPCFFVYTLLWTVLHIKYHHSWLSAAERSQLDFSLSQSWSDLKPTEICDYITHISKSACSFIWLDTDKYQACVCVSGMWTQGWSPAVTVQERRAVWEELWFSELWVWTAAVDQTRTVHVPAYLCHHGLGPVLKVNTFKGPLCWP